MKNLFLIFFLFWSYNVFAEVKQLQVIDLSCNFLTNPLGIDALPKLSWKIVSGEKGQLQTAYEVRVAKSIQSLNSNSPDMWNTGKVLSNQSILVEYNGIPLKSAQRVYWKVRIWDKQGKPSTWSEVAWWEKGLDGSAWKGKWIGTRDKLPQDNPQLDSACWIWLQDNNYKTSAISSAWFYKEFEIDRTKTIKWAKFVFSTLGKYSVWINDKLADTGCEDSAKVIDASAFVKTGFNTIKVFAELTGNDKGMIGEIKIRYQDGASVSFTTNSAWMASETDPKNSLPGKLTGVVITGRFDKRPIQSVPKLPYEVDPAPYLRKAFSSEGKIKSARIYICGLGYYELFLNGKKTGDHVLDPTYTRYDKRVLYVTYDVTDQVEQGKNVLGIVLGNGFFNQHARDVWYFHKAPWRATPRVLLQMNITYENGKELQVVSDSTWKFSTGPVVFDGIRNGEYYDARRENPDWNQPSTADSAWKNVVEVSAPMGQLCAQEMPPIRVTQTIPYKEVTHPAEGIWVYNIGQNIAGWARIKVKGPKGATVSLKYGEKLDGAGRVDQSNINWYLFQGKMQEDHYILKGEGEETWEPSFVFHGFQYVEITGLTDQTGILSVEGRVIHTDFKKTGDFTCSDSLINHIHRNACWSYRGNFPGIPIDCPQREKNGWLADAHLAMETGLMNYENTAAYYSWLKDLRDEQAPSGQLPGIVPTSGWGYNQSGGPSWETAFLLIPWYIYNYKGDTSILKVNYPSWKKQMQYLANNAEDHLLNFGLNDWLAIEPTPAIITSSGTYYYNAIMMSKTAHILGLKEDETKYAALADSIKGSFLNHFFDKNTGKIGPGTQMAQLEPLYYHWVDSADTKLILQYLVKDIQQHNNHFTIGAIGSKMILRTLCDYGYGDLAYTLATQTSYPSWGEWISKGATTLWENWNGLESLNHIFMGDIDAWFYSYLTGIRTDETHPGFKHFIIKPFIPVKLSYASSNVESPYGLIHSAWQKKEHSLMVDITVPVNTSASFYIPNAYRGKITGTEVSLSGQKATKSVKMEGVNRIISLPAGTFNFEVYK